MPFDAVREGPLVCTAHSVKMILRGQKTHSRRVCARPKGMDGICDACWFSSSRTHGSVPTLDVAGCPHRGIPGGRIRSPYGGQGDRLWIRESYRTLADGRLLYRADHPDDPGPWKNVRFVPKSAARFWVSLLSVRVERLWCITDDDARAEGFPQSKSPRNDFAVLWDEINGKRDNGAHTWAKNPWVWTLVFRRVEAP